jgi:hypothetical protein
VQSTSGALVLGLATDGLSFVVFGTVAFSIVMSVLFLVTRGNDSMYDQIGAGGISRESDYGGIETPAAKSEQEQEVRQMLRARSERAVKRGEPALDVEAEVARLLGGGGSSAERDPEMVAEVRQLVEARNERRIRKGMEPLDVETEISRTLGELDP